MADDTIINFNEARAEITGNGTLWTPADALRACLRDIEAGRIKPDKIYIAMAMPHEDGPSSFPWYNAGTVSLLETIGLLTQHVQIQTE